MINHYYQRDWYGMLDLSEATISPGEVHHCHGQFFHCHEAMVSIQKTPATPERPE
jgi:hypothetical protein